MLATDFEQQVGAVRIHTDEVAIGDTIVWFGDVLCYIDRFETNLGPLVMAELVPFQWIAVCSNGVRITLPDDKVPCLPRTAVAA